MRIAYCIGALNKTGGAERVLVNKANYLADVFGYTVFILIANQVNLPLCYKVSKKVKIIDMKIVSYFDKKNIPIFSATPSPSPPSSPSSSPSSFSWTRVKVTSPDSTIKNSSPSSPCLIMTSFNA